MEAEAVIARLGVFRDGILLANAGDVLSALDSLDLVELTQFIESTFGIRVGLEDVTVTNFASLAAIVSMVCGKIGRDGV